MTIIKKKISELPIATSLDGLLAFGVDSSNRSVKISLNFLNESANHATAQGDYAKTIADDLSNLKLVTSVAANDTTEYNEITI